MGVDVLKKRGQLFPRILFSAVVENDRNCILVSYATKSQKYTKNQVEEVKQMAAAAKSTAGQISAPGTSAVAEKTAQHILVSDLGVSKLEMNRELQWKCPNRFGTFWLPLCANQFTFGVYFYLQLIIVLYLLHEVLCASILMSMLYTNMNSLLQHLVLDLYFRHKKSNKKKISNLEPTFEMQKEQVTEDIYKIYYGYSNKSKVERLNKNSDYFEGLDKPVKILSPLLGIYF
ncbi:hypothetical protein M9H77_02715 [Catharanthus roseus]|uniref:Uncharacterized protein n=1 Tax=Catharanthus roseus TaxID=4058 RepID=A0ACC0C964_CATRO|nr:hypothetical protein M9H77_02715 [Catharanthus roseus]